MELFVFILMFLGLFNAVRFQSINAIYIKENTTSINFVTSHTVLDQPLLKVHREFNKDTCNGDNGGNCGITASMQEGGIKEFVYNVDGTNSSTYEVKENVTPTLYVRPTPTSYFPNYTTHCLQDDIYPSLEKCYEDCFALYEGNRTNEFTFSINDQVVTHKVIVLTEGEYTIKDGILAANDIGKFNNDSYIVSNNSVYLCLPLDESLKTCHLTYYTSSDYERRGNKIWFKSRKRFYDIEHFYYYEIFVRLCSNFELNQKLTELGKVHEIGIIISTVFLALTVLIILSSSRIKKRYNRPLQCFIIMLFFGYCILTIRLFLNFGILCATLAFANQFCFLSAFFWMNSQAIDLYISINTLQPTSDTIQQKNKRFIFYCIYSWGLPACITGFTALTEFFGPFGTFETHFMTRCWFYKDHIITNFALFYGWVVVTLVINIILFILILIKFRSIGRAIFAANRNIFKQLIHISIKLVILMGFWWICKVVIWSSPSELINSMWYLSCVNLLCSFHGVFVFLIYSCKIKTMFQKSCRKMRRRLSSSDDSRSSITRTSLVYSIKSLKFFPTSQILRNTSLKSSSSNNRVVETINQSV